MVETDAVLEKDGAVLESVDCAEDEAFLLDGGVGGIKEVAAGFKFGDMRSKLGVDEEATGSD